LGKELTDEKAHQRSGNYVDEMLHGLTLAHPGLIRDGAERWSVETQVL